MSNTHHFITIASAEDLRAAFPGATVWTNEHTDPEFFVHTRLHNYSLSAAWDRMVESLGGNNHGEPEDAIEWNTDAQVSGMVDKFSLRRVEADEAADMIELAKAYMQSGDLDLTNDDN